MSDVCDETTKRRTYPLRLPLIGPLILMVDPTEIRYYYRHGQGYHQHTTKGAHTTDDFTSYRLGYHISVTGKW